MVSTHSDMSNIEENNSHLAKHLENLAYENYHLKLANAEFKSQICQQNVQIEKLSSDLESQEKLIQEMIDEREEEMKNIKTRLFIQAKRLATRKIQVESRFQELKREINSKNEMLKISEENQLKLKKDLAQLLIQINTTRDWPAYSGPEFQSRHLMKKVPPTEIIFNSSSDPVLEVFKNLTQKSFNERITSLWENGLHGKNLASTNSLIIGELLFDFDQKSAKAMTLTVKPLQQENLEWANGKIIHFNRTNRVRRRASY